jgi:hypothetical protein
MSSSDIGVATRSLLLLNIEEKQIENNLINSSPLNIWYFVLVKVLKLRRTVLSLRFRIRQSIEV